MQAEQKYSIVAQVYKCLLSCDSVGSRYSFILRIGEKTSPQSTKRTPLNQNAIEFNERTTLQITHLQKARAINCQILLFQHKDHQEKIKAGTALVPMQDLKSKEKRPIRLVVNFDKRAIIELKIYLEQINQQQKSSKFISSGCGKNIRLKQQTQSHQRSMTVSNEIHPSKTLSYRQASDEVQEGGNQSLSSETKTCPQYFENYTEQHNQRQRRFSRKRESDCDSTPSSVQKMSNLKKSKDKVNAPVRIIDKISSQRKGGLLTLDKAKNSQLELNAEKKGKRQILKLDTQSSNEQNQKVLKLGEIEKNIQKECGFNIYKSVEETISWKKARKMKLNSGLVGISINLNYLKKMGVDRETITEGKTSWNQGSMTDKNERKSKETSTSDLLAKLEKAVQTLLEIDTYVGMKQIRILGESQCMSPIMSLQMSEELMKKPETGKKGDETDFSIRQTDILLKSSEIEQLRQCKNKSINKQEEQVAEQDEEMYNLRLSVHSKSSQTIKSRLKDGKEVLLPKSYRQFQTQTDTKPLSQITTVFSVPIVPQFSDINPQQCLKHPSPIRDPFSQMQNLKHSQIPQPRFKDKCNEFAVQSQNLELNSLRFQHCLHEDKDYSIENQQSLSKSGLKNLSCDRSMFGASSHDNLHQLLRLTSNARKQSLSISKTVQLRVRSLSQNKPLLTKIRHTQNPKSKFSQIGFVKHQNTHFIHTIHQTNESLQSSQHVNSLKRAPSLIANQSEKYSKNTPQKSVRIQEDDYSDINIQISQEVSIVEEGQEENRSFSKDTHFKVEERYSNQKDIKIVIHQAQQVQTTNCFDLEKASKFLQAANIQISQSLRSEKESLYNHRFDCQRNTVRKQEYMKVEKELVDLRQQLKVVGQKKLILEEKRLALENQKKEHEKQIEELKKQNNKISQNFKILKKQYHAYAFEIMEKETNNQLKQHTKTHKINRTQTSQTIMFNKQATAQESLRDFIPFTPSKCFKTQKPIVEKKSCQFSISTFLQSKQSQILPQHSNSDLNKKKNQANSKFSVGSSIEIKEKQVKQNNTIQIGKIEMKRFLGGSLQKGKRGGSSEDSKCINTARYEQKSKFYHTKGGSTHSSILSFCPSTIIEDFINKQISNDNIRSAK